MEQRYVTEPHYHHCMTPVLFGQLPTSLHMITEEATPLQVSLENCKSDFVISWGIHQILVSGLTSLNMRNSLVHTTLLQVNFLFVFFQKAVTFLNIDCSLVHRNLCQSSVFVDTAGEWKLGGMEFVWEFSEDALPPFKLLRDLNKYNPPELANETRGKKITKWYVYKCSVRACLQHTLNIISLYRSTDMWGLGCLIHEVFNGALTQLSSLRNTSKVSLDKGAVFHLSLSFQIPNPLIPAFCQLVGANPKSRPNPSNLLDELKKQGGYLSNRFVSINLSIEEVQASEMCCLHKEACNIIF